MDILVTPSDDAAVTKKRSKKITGARDLTSKEYSDMLRNAQKKKEEAEKEKQAKKEEREKKKKDREQKKREQESARSVRGRGRGRRHGKRQANATVDDSGSENSCPPSPLLFSEVSEPESEEEAPPFASSRPPRQRTQPSRFRQDSSESDNNDGAICVLWDSNEPESLPASTIF